MAACGPDREMYDLIRAFYRQETVADYACEEKAVEKLGEGTWFQSYHGLLQNCIREITRYTEVQDFGQQVLGSETDVYEWLNRFYKNGFATSTGMKITDLPSTQIRKENLYPYIV